MPSNSSGSLARGTTFIEGLEGKPSAFAAEGSTGFGFTVGAGAAGVAATGFAARTKISDVSVGSEVIKIPDLSEAWIGQA